MDAEGGDSFSVYRDVVALESFWDVANWTFLAGEAAGRGFR